MKKKVAIGYQDFAELITNNFFYIDKTGFIEEWWGSGDKVTLITRPRRFGKTLLMSMVEQFFSIEYKGRSDLFMNFTIWKQEAYRSLQGTYPVISLSFDDIKETAYPQARKKIGENIVDLYNRFDFLGNSDVLNEKEKKYFHSISADMEDYELSISIRRLSNYLYKYYGKKVIILMDEYDTPMQEAYVNQYWENLTSFTRSLFNASFKSNPYLERAIMTGITRVSKESIFSDLNNLKVVTTVSDEYADSFGFTEAEVFQVLNEYGLSDEKEDVKKWYDGFTFGSRTDIYNPWSIINFLDKGRVGPYWANTSSNRLIGELIRRGSSQIKETFEDLLAGESIMTELDEQIVYEQLDIDESAIWSLLLAGGYLKVSGAGIKESSVDWRKIYSLEITNFEVKIMFRDLVRTWFSESASSYNDFIKALLQDDIKAMNVYMNRVAQATFSFFDSGKKPSGESEPERFYHGFVLGLMVELEDQYRILSNRESGFGRYDVMLEPKDISLPAYIIEFKVQDPDGEKELSDTVKEALKQIDEKKYDVGLVSKGFSEAQIRKYGFAFRGKEVLIGRSNPDRK
mgnify:CR=1 FL=1